MLEVKLRGEAVERKAFDEFHDDGRRIGFIEHGKNRDHCGISERGGVARFLEHPLAHLRVRARTQDFDGDAAIQLLIVRGIHHAQPAFSELSFEAKARQPRGLLLALRRRPALALAQLAHVQAGLDALARLVADGFGQLREELLPLFGGGIRASAQEGFRVRGRIHHGRALRQRHWRHDGECRFGWRRIQEIARAVVGAQE